MSGPQSPLDFGNTGRIIGPQKHHGWLHSTIVGGLGGLLVWYLARKNWHRRCVRLAYCGLMAGIGAVLPALLVVAGIGLVWIEVRPGDQSWVVPTTSFIPGGLVWLRLTWKWARGLLRNNGGFPKRTRP